MIHLGIVAGRVMLPSILNTLQRISNPLDGLKMQFSAISYQPFLSLMNMTGMFESGQVPPAIGTSRWCSLVDWLISLYS